MMMENLLTQLRRPALWQRSEPAFWDDDHISQGMLAAHLDPLEDAASRSLETIEGSVAWLSRVLPGGCRVLDLGCGPGLYARRLSQRGYAVTGVDLSRRSIAYAARQDARTRYLRQNYLELDVPGPFDAALMIYCDYAALTPPERVRLLEHVSRVLRPGGLFLFDVFTPAYPMPADGTTDWEAAEQGGFWSPQPYLSLDAAWRYEAGTVLAETHTVLTASGAKTYIIWDTRYTRQSLTRELADSGFRVREAFGDVCGRSWREDSPVLCVLAEKEGEHHA